VVPAQPDSVDDEAVDEDEKTRVIS
jgi:hypothetical protein